MNRQLRKLWLLPWIDERNAVACGAQVIVDNIKKLPPGAMRNNSQHALQVVDAWQDKRSDQYDKTLVEALRQANARRPLHNDVTFLVSVCERITVRAVTGDLTSNITQVRGLLEALMYADGVDEIANDAMAKWRFYDATARKKIDPELRGAFEAYWLAGEYKAGYEFVGAAWPTEWTPEFMTANSWRDEDMYEDGSAAKYGLLYLRGLVQRDVQ
jgi:hypothetical protein